MSHGAVSFRVIVRASGSRLRSFGNPGARVKCLHQVVLHPTIDVATLPLWAMAEQPHIAPPPPWGSSCRCRHHSFRSWWELPGLANRADS